jgi:hypothetical protein
MDVFLRILFGLFIIFIGFTIVWKTAWYQEWTGRIAFAEDKLGAGGTSSFLKIIGMLVCFVGMAVATNLIDDILTSFAGIFIRGR